MCVCVAIVMVALWSHMAESDWCNGILVSSVVLYTMIVEELITIYLENKTRREREGEGGRVREGEGWREGGGEGGRERGRVRDGGRGRGRGREPGREGG